MLRIGEWWVNPGSGQVSRDGQNVRLDERAMRLLQCLASRAGEVVSIDDLLNQVWSEVTVSPDSVYQAVASLRRQLGDDPKSPTYIATVPRLGYRMVAPVSEVPEHASLTPPCGDTVQNATANGGMRRLRIRMALTAALPLAALAIYLYVARMHSSVPRASAAPPQQSIAVLPFLDLTPGRKEEEFADGMTEELIGRFSKIPGLRVPSPTSVFFYKEKKVPVADIARSLGVTYVVDGSVRESGDNVRISARLVRAENGYVIWSESYDRPFSDRIRLQDEIATEVTKALQSSVAGKP